MTVAVEISRIIGVSGNAASGLVTINVLLKDGLEGSLLINAPVADGLLSPLYQTLRKMADLVRRGILGQQQVQAFDIQTAQVGYDSSTRSVVLLFDHGKPSQSAWRLSEKALTELNLGIAKAMQDLSEQPQSEKPH